MDNILVLNLGTTSFKCKLFSCGEEGQQMLAQGEVESVGAESGRFVLRDAAGNERGGVISVRDHTQALVHCLTLLKEMGVLSGLDGLNAIGYKAVHGGCFSGTREVDSALIAEMERMRPLAPAHNPIYLRTMKEIRRQFPGLRQVVRFETSFHADIPDYRTVYGVPYRWQEWGIRKYGFHGSSHQYIAETVRARRIISCHLGGSSSICAILDGKSIAVSMGATPQSGLFSNNRVGDFDIFCLPLLLRHYGTVERVLEALSKESGLLGLSGVSNDLREVIRAMESGDRQAELAVEALADSVLGYIGMYTAYLGGLDALVFTGGIGCNSALIRKMVCEKLRYMGVKLDALRNEGTGDGTISSADSAIPVWRLKTNEELIVARNVYRFLREQEGAAVGSGSAGGHRGLC